MCQTSKSHDLKTTAMSARYHSQMSQQHSQLSALSIKVIQPEQQPCQGRYHSHVTSTTKQCQEGFTVICPQHLHLVSKISQSCDLNNNTMSRRYHNHMTLTPSPCQPDITVNVTSATQPCQESITVIWPQHHYLVSQISLSCNLNNNSQVSNIFEKGDFSITTISVMYHSNGT